MQQIVRAHILDNDPAVLRWMNDHPNILASDDSQVDEIDLEMVDVLVFTGGCDVHPKFYGEEPREAGYEEYDIERDLRELELFERTRLTHYHFGICRGLQLLAVAHGYKLWQHISGHALAGNHALIGTAGAYKDQYIEGATSSHHQCVRADNKNNTGLVLGVEDYGQPVAAYANDRESAELNEVIESMWFKHTSSFGVQGHPEYGNASKDYINYVFQHMLEDEDTGYYNQFFDTYKQT